MINNTVTMEMLKAALSNVFNDIPEMHRNIYRGKYLGSSVTAEQQQAIQNGTFDGLFIGDYWTIDGKDWVIADIDYFYNTGYSPNFTKHHLVMLPRTPLYSYVMNNSGNTSGGYLNSDMRKTGLNEAKSIITSAFGSLVLSHHDIFVNAVSNGHPSGVTWTMSDVELMNEIMVYGSFIHAAVNEGTIIPANYTTAKTQLAIFRLNMKFLHDMRSYIWLRDVVSAHCFAYVHYYGDAGYGTAANGHDVLPYFVIGV